VLRIGREPAGGLVSVEWTRQAEGDRGKQAAVSSAMQLGFKEVLQAAEGLLLPDKPAVPGVSRINMSPYLRSRLRANPHLRAPRPRRQPPRSPSR
jgi:hypothetical protein